MKRVICCFFAIMLLCLSVCQRQEQQPKHIRKALDLWGSEIRLSKYRHGVLLIYPFSPLYCGYCLVDGEFVRENYYRNTIEQGGTFFGMCLFNPQLDIYSFQKHYREEFPVLTAPVSLHLLYNGGFPFMIAFEDGKSIYSDCISPYEEVFDTLRTRLWKSKDVPLRPTSPGMMAYYFVEENESGQGIIVLADGDRAGMKREEEKIKRVKQL
jgi:hypothetical protein